jgi:hypothetical protein
MMPHDQNTSLQIRYPGFQSFKVSRPIHYRQRFCRIALVLDTLNERVLELAPAEDPLGENNRGTDCTYRRHIGARWETVCIGRPSGMDDEMRFNRRLTREQISALPGFENARMIWKARNTKVTLLTRMTALERTADGQTATLGDLLRAIRDAAGSPDELLALIADGTLQIDASKALSGLTPIHRRAAHPA